ncbi:EAL domain-containing protein [Kineosporia rhizophila]|uniref:EAL domain-containing protein n=1 Tax=Kineosporia TaxID=49184 RepID=UPI001E3AD167|nr:MULTISPECIES: EAL domain-containing protein [Kineosporia]MCE0537846.1 EAL domain-containing protein [Kineosporia rhizophila]
MPLWLALAAITLPPLIVAAVMGGLLVRRAQADAQEAAEAQELVASVKLLDAARRASDAEVLPTLLLDVLAEKDAASELGFQATRRDLLSTTEPAVVRQRRVATDQALEAVLDAPLPLQLRGVVIEARQTLLAARRAADNSSQVLETVASGYSRTSATLAAGQRWATAQAVAAGLSSHSVAALQDLTQVAQLSEAASRQLGLLFAARVLPGALREEAERGWMAAWGKYTELADQGNELSSARVREGYQLFQSTPSVAAFSDLLARQALDPGTEVVRTGALPGLVDRSGTRDDAVAVVLQDAVAEVTDSAQADRDAAQARERAALAGCLALVLLSLLIAGLLSRWLTRSMSSLAGSAQQISQGHLVVAQAQGPREMRTAAAALTSAVAGLRRVQEQARAVVDGDPEAALRLRPLPGPLGEVVHASIEQIVDTFRAREALQEELAHQANHDPLTGLANRAQVLEQLTALLGDDEPETHTGVLFIDLDGFKAVNDTHGHAAGDRVLIEVAQRLSAGLRPSDVVGRFGGDEFVVLLPKVPGIAPLAELAQRLVAAVSWSGPLDGGADGDRGAVRNVQVGASIGVALSSPDSTADTLLAEADLAAYRAKRAGRGRVEVFDDRLRAELSEQAEMEVALREGLEAGELHLHYQPVVNLHTGVVVGFEALARWERPGVGPVRPDIFIAAAEASSLVCDLGRWVLHAALAQVTRWKTFGEAGFGTGEDEPTMAVNISGRHLSDNRILNDVYDALNAAGLPASVLVLEITETVLTTDPQVREHLRQLRASGVQVAIDDFGTGFTSVAALVDTPADILKIDRSFVDSDDPGHHQLATLITRAAQTFSLRVIAEGIETPEQLARVMADGCEEAQGYLFSRPLPPEAVGRLPASLVPQTSSGSLLKDLPRQAEAPENSEQRTSVPGGPA